jgi:hypothetical protein
MTHLVDATLAVHLIRADVDEALDAVHLQSFSVVNLSHQDSKRYGAADCEACMGTEAT